MISDQKVTLIGAGNVGCGLHHALTKTDIESTLVGKILEDQKRQVAQADIVLITVQDSHIQAVCEEISEALASGTVVAHCSGALSCDVLKSAQNQGAYIASAHPLNTFPNREAAITLLDNPNHNTYCYISGQPEATSSLSGLFKHLGFNTALLNDDAKLAYHAACVFACNYLTSLAEFSLQTAELGQIKREDFWRAIQPLMNATLNNISDNGTTQALSGPIARGDVTTVAKHLEFLADAPKNIRDAYRVLGQQALNLAHAKSPSNEKPNHKIKTLLS